MVKEWKEKKNKEKMEMEQKEIEQKIKEKKEEKTKFEIKRNKLKEKVNQYKKIKVNKLRYKYIYIIKMNFIILIQEDQKETKIEDKKIIIIDEETRERLKIRNDKILEKRERMKLSKLIKNKKKSYKIKSKVFIIVLLNYIRSLIFIKIKMERDPERLRQLTMVFEQRQKALKEKTITTTYSGYIKDIQHKILPNWCKV